MAESSNITSQDGVTIEGLSKLGEQKAQRIISLVRTIPDFPAKGIKFRDFIPVLNDGDAFSDLIDALVKNLPVPADQIDYVGGLESRGFLIGAPLALKLHKGFVSFRKAGKLPPQTLKQTYGLEYGHASIEIEKGIIPSGSHVLIVDDLIATGGTAQAAQELVKRSGADVAGFEFVVELNGLDGRNKLGSAPSSSLISMPA
jgi:adenine phosphoribosyltransferase